MIFVQSCITKQILQGQVRQFKQLCARFTAILPTNRKAKYVQTWFSNLKFRELSQTVPVLTAARNQLHPNNKFLCSSNVYPQ